MKRIVSLAMALALSLSLTACGSTQSTSGSAASAGSAAEEVTGYTVGICQLMEHESLDKATNGFMDALTEEMQAVGKTVDFDMQVAGEANLCTTVINTFTAKEVDLIMANATPALLAAANATTKIPVLGTSVTDYADTFAGNIPANVSGTSDAVPFDEQASMMIDTLGLVEGDVVGVLYCTNESNSLIQYNAVKELFEAAGIVVEAYTFSEITELQALVTTARPCMCPLTTPLPRTTPLWAPSAPRTMSPSSPATAALSAMQALPSTTMSWAARPARWPLRSCWARRPPLISRSLP